MIGNRHDEMNRRLFLCQMLVKRIEEMPVRRSPDILPRRIVVRCTVKCIEPLGERQLLDGIPFRIASIPKLHTIAQALKLRRHRSEIHLPIALRLIIQIYADIAEARYKPCDRHQSKRTIRHKRLRIKGLILSNQTLDAIGSMKIGILRKHRPLRIRFTEDDEDMFRLGQTRPFRRARETCLNPLPLIYVPS